MYATFTGFVSGETSSVLGGTLALSTSAGTTSAVGTYPIQVGGLSRLYTLLRLPAQRSGLLELRFTPGISAYAFTFG